MGKEEWRAQVPDSDCLGIQSVFGSKAIWVSWEAIFAPLSASTWELFKGCFWGLRASKTPTVSEAAKSVSADLGVCVRACDTVLVTFGIVKSSPVSERAAIRSYPCKLPSGG